MLLCETTLMRISVEKLQHKDYVLFIPQNTPIQFYKIIYTSLYSTKKFIKDPEGTTEKRYPNFKINLILMRSKTFIFLLFCPYFSNVLCA